MYACMQLGSSVGQPEEGVEEKGKREVEEGTRAFNKRTRHRKIAKKGQKVKSASTDQAATKTKKVGGESARKIISAPCENPTTVQAKP